MPSLAPSALNLFVLALAAFLLTGLRASAANLTWDANGASAGQTDGSGAWLAANQWWDGSSNVNWASGDSASFGNGGNGSSVSLASPTTVGSLGFNSFSGTYTLGTAGQVLTLNSGINMASGSAEVTFVGPINLGGEQTWTNNSTGGLVTGSTANLIDNGGHQLTIDGAGTTSFGQVGSANVTLAGSGALVKSGSGRLNVGGLNSGFTGAVTINGGQLQMYNNADGLGSGNVTLNGGVLSFYWSTNYNRTLGTGNNQIQLIGGESGFGGGGKYGPSVNLGGTLVWGANGEGAATGYFNPSKFVLGDPEARTSSSSSLSNGIDLNGATRTIKVPFGASASANGSTIWGTIQNSTGTAGLIKEGGGTLVLSSANTYNGGTTIEEGTLQMNHLNSLGSNIPTLTVNGGLLNLNNKGDLTVGNLTGTGGIIANNGANNRTLTIGSGDGSGGNFQGVIADTTGADSGTLALAKTGTGTITLSGTNTYTGATTVSAGVLRIGSGDTSGSLATSAVTNDGTLIYDRSDDFSVGYSINGDGDLIKQGAGTMTLTVSGAYSGDTTISAGGLKLNHPVATNDDASLTIAATGATLDLNFTGTETVRDLYIGATQMEYGVYKAIGNPAAGTEIAQITGNGTLTVAGDVTVPTFLSIVDDQNGRHAVTDSPVTYTITFSEAIDMSSVSAADFVNAGTAPISIGSITQVSPGVLTVLVTPTDTGTLQLKIPTGAVLTDLFGNPLNTAADIQHDSSLTIYVPDYGFPELIGVSPIVRNDGAEITLQIPEGVKPGDLLIAHLAHYASGTTGAVFINSTGWRSLSYSRLSGQLNTRIATYYKEVTAADSEYLTLDLAYDAPYATAAVVLAFSNVDMLNGPLDVGISGTYSEIDPTASAGPVNSISTVSTDTFLLMFGMAIGDNTVEWSDWATTSHGSFTELYDVSNSDGVKSISLGAAWAHKAAPGATGTGSATLSGSIHNGSVMYALKPTYNAALVSALNGLQAHIVSGETLLTSGQIAAHKQTISDNRLSLRSSVTSLVAALDLVRTYDEELGPLWVARNLPGRSQLNDDLHYTIFTVMQYLMDYGYTAANIADHYDLLNNFAFGSSAHFPGACPAPADPEQTHTALIDADYPNTWGREVFGQDNASPKPTGTYLAPGSIATVTVPASMVGRGYTIRVGAHSWDFSARPRLERLDRCSLVYPIDSTTTQVANPLGGGIYIEVPKYIDGVGVVSVQIKNAVRSPYFSAKSFHQTTLAEWQNTERHHSAPWADFQSEKVMMQVPTDWIYALDDPVTLMADWDKSVDITNDLMGFPRDRGRETIYNQVDLMFRTVAYTPGYPAVNNTYNPNSDYGGYANNYLVRGPQYAPDFEFHELGHAYRYRKFPGETESDVNLLHVAVFEQGFGYSLDEAFRKSRGAPAYATLDTTVIAWMMCDNFLNGNIMEQAEKQYALKGHAKFVEIARLFGWDRLADYYTTFNVDDENDTLPSKWDPSLVNILLTRLCSKVGVDVRPLFHFWGVPPVAGVAPYDSASLEASIQAANLPKSRLIYDTLVRYKSLLPADNAAFRTFALGWHGSQPSIDGYSEERNHATRWDDYDATMAAATADRAQQIIDLYFPSGRPSDYGDWRSQWAEADLVNPQLDLDGDGMSNDNERIWGLDPTSAISSNPITSSIGLKTSGSFTYTRRDQVLTGLNYSVWSSTNLKDWAEDTGAQQTLGALDRNGVRTVDANLRPELLDSPSLFIQLRTSE